LSTNPYTPEFYAPFREGSKESARRIVPLILELIGCQSVIDLGCGLGVWLSVFREHGIKRTVGVDGAYVETDSLAISKEDFVPFDLTKPFRINEQFDLAMSLEVAEHISAEHAETYLNSLVTLAPVILFSASIPFQEGLNHVNEQWPDYWVKHFEERGYTVIDCLRSRIWRDSNIEWWYAQNTMLFVKKDRLAEYPALKEYPETAMDTLPIVHPRLYLHKEDRLRNLEREVARLETRVARLRSPKHIFLSLPRVAYSRFIQMVSGR
jgi:SAM-dependent methyltransferase